MRKTSLILSSLLAVASIIAWARSYRITDLFCWRDRQAQIWVVSTASGALSLSKSTFPKQPFWRVTPPPQGHVAVVEWKGLNRDWPAALLLFDWMDSGPEDRIRDYKTTERSSVLGLGSQTGVIASPAAVYVQCHEISIPFWAISSLALVLSVLRIRQAVLRRRRRRLAHCPICNYDLRASTTRCPECGHPIPTPQNPPPTPPPAEADSSS